MKRGRPKQHVRYIRRAVKNFLKGTNCRTPEQVVRTGLRTLEEWADLLRLERDVDRVQTAQMRSGRQTGADLQPDLV